MAQCWMNLRKFSHYPIGLSGLFSSFDPAHPRCYHFPAGWSSLVARWAHNPKVGGSNPPPATKPPVWFQWVEPLTNWLGDSKPKFPAEISRILYAQFYATPNGNPHLMCFRASRSAVHDYRSPLKSHINLLTPSVNRCLESRLLRRESAGQVEFRSLHCHRVFRWRTLPRNRRPSTRITVPR
jgi:hypothetical protein